MDFTGSGIFQANISKYKTQKVQIIMFTFLHVY